MIEIIPKKPKEKRPWWQNFLLYFSLGILLATISSYFIIGIFHQKAKVVLQNLQTHLERTSQEKEIESEILNTKKRIDHFAELLENHIAPSNIFPLLEKNTLPEIWFTSFRFNSEETSVVLSGEASDFRVLGQQLLIFKHEPLIKEVKLGGISLTEGGRVNFTFDLLLSPQVLKYD